MTFTVAKWYGYIFSIMFILYGGVKILLGFLDRNYEGVSTPFVFLLAGIVMITLCFAYRDNRPWGWYGLVVLNGLVVVLALFGLREAMNIVFLVLSLGALGALLSPSTTRAFFQPR